MCIRDRLTGCLDSFTDEDLESVTLGCTYKDAVNYDPNAQADDGSCLYDADGDGIVDNLELYGCTYDKAENFNPDATEEDGSCEFAEPVSGCTDKTASNYNSYAEKDDGTCEYVIFGCMDENADNYDSEAQLDNNTCVYYGCIYEDANKMATNFYSLNDLVINPSCEHMSDEWFNKIPKGTHLILQSNDFWEVPEHINVVKNIEEMKKKYKMKDIYSCTLQCTVYQRFTLAGIKT